MSMKILSRPVLFLAVFSFLCAASARADEVSLEAMVKQLQKRVEALEKKLEEHNCCIVAQNETVLKQQKKIDMYETEFSKINEKLQRGTGAPIQIGEGLDIAAGITTIVQGTNNTNGTDTKKHDRADASYSADITISKNFKNIDGRAFLHLEPGYGNGLEDQLTLYSNVNRDVNNTDNNVPVTEFYYEQLLFDKKALIMFGKLDPTILFDSNTIANDETTKFLARMFRNNPAIEFPDNSIALYLALTPAEWMTFSYGAFDGDADWERVFDNLFNIGQVNFKPNLGGLEGNYRFFIWDSNINHTKWLDTSKEKENNYGMGLSFDQKISDVFTLFTRYGWQDPKVYNPNITATGGYNYSIEQSWSAGLQIDGKPWSRQEDCFGIALGQVFPSKDYKKAGSSSIASPNAKPEGHIESYYNIHVTDHLYISPDIQYIWNAFGKDIADDKDGVFVGGVRVQIDF